MADINQVLSQVVSGLGDTLKECGFTVVIPAGTESGELPATVKGGKITIDFKGENRALRLEHFNNKISLLAAEKEGDITDGDFGQLTISLLDPEEANDKDVRYITNELSESLLNRFGKNAPKQKTKLPTPVSKAAAKSGMAAYDANTLASRLSTTFPELKEAYKANFELYGEFLPEDFFDNHGTKVIIDVIKQNDPQKMRRLFNLLNEIYDDGTNETQSLIAVTILGKLNNDQELLANCVDYMSDSMCAPVINVNKMLAKSKGLRMRIENPPQYKPKKQSRGAMSHLGNQK